MCTSIYARIHETSEKRDQSIWYMYSHTQAASKHFMINCSHEVIVVMQLSPIYLDIMCAVHIRFRDITRLVR